MVWGVFARTIFTLHVTWAVQLGWASLGYRNYATRDNSRNSWWVALCTLARAGTTTIMRINAVLGMDTAGGSSTCPGSRFESWSEWG